MKLSLILPAILLGTVTAFAANSVELSEENTTQIRNTLTAQGYQVSKIKIEDGLYEAYVRKDGNRYEVFLDGKFDIVLRKLDD